MMEPYFKAFASDYENVKSLFDNMNDGLLITNDKLEIIAVNPAFKQITGYDYEEVKYKTPRIFQSGKTMRGVFDEMWEHINKKGSWTGELLNKRKNGEEFHSYITITHIKKEQEDESYYIGMMRDITERKQDHERISYLAYHDPLTQLPNRTAFMREVTDKIEYLKDKEEQLAVIFLDLDRFKNVNDTLGHQMGDELLVKITKRLRLLVGNRGLIGRFGGDEFIIFLHSITSKKEAYHFVEEVVQSFQKPISCGGETLYITSSMGLSFYPEHGTDAHTLIKNADTAMYKSKDESRNNYEEYHHSMTEGAPERLQLENELHEAILKQQFEVHYQLQVDTTTGDPYGMEALVRWNHPEKGIVSPALFIQVAEETGLIKQIDEWVLRTACKQTKDWHRKGLNDLVISVNISQQLFERSEFIHMVTSVLQETALEPNKLCIEITENTAIVDIERAIKKLKELRKMGVKISLDDFGTGYSSLSQLRSFPLDTIKIDQSFVKELTGEQESQAIVKLIIGMAKNLKFSVICEGVETIPQLQIIRNEGCFHMQGYLFSKPVSHQICEELMFNMKQNLHEYSFLTKNGNM